MVRVNLAELSPSSPAVFSADHLRSDAVVCQWVGFALNLHLIHIHYGVPGYRFAYVLCVCLVNIVGRVYGLCSLETLILNYTQLQIPEVKEESTEKRRWTMAGGNAPLRDKKQLFVPECDIFFELSGNVMWWLCVYYVPHSQLKGYTEEFAVYRWCIWNVNMCVCVLFYIVFVRFIRIWIVLRNGFCR